MTIINGEKWTPEQEADYVKQRAQMQESTDKRAKTDFYSLIRNIEAEDGFVMIRMNAPYPDQQLTVDAALERAEGIKNMTVDGNARTLFFKLYEAAAAARVQWDSVLRGMSEKDRLSLPEMLVSQENCRRMELFKQQRLDDLVGVEKVTV